MKWKWKKQSRKEGNEEKKWRERFFSSCDRSKLMGVWSKPVTGDNIEGKEIVFFYWIFTKRIFCACLQLFAFLSFQSTTHRHRNHFILFNFGCNSVRYVDRWIYHARIYWLHSLFDFRSSGSQLLTFKRQVSQVESMTRT